MPNERAHEILAGIAKPPHPDYEHKTWEEPFGLFSGRPHHVLRRYAMRLALTTLAAPAFVIAMLAVMVNYSGPSELWAAMQPIDSKLKPVNAGVPNVETAVRDLSERAPEPVAASAKANSDCFQRLALADQAKLDRCSKVVYQTLINLEKEAGSPVVQNTLEAKVEQRQVIQQLRLAATEVCRVSWAKRKTYDAFEFDNPACEASQVLLASDTR